MQAVILAAGMGKRLGDLTKDNTKCMIEVNGVTLIERLLFQLDNLHLNRIVLVVGYQAAKLQDFVASLPIKTRIEYIENNIYNKTNNIYSLYLAKQYLKEDDTLLFESDLIVEDKVINRLLENEYPDLALVAKFESWMDGTVVTIDECNNIVRFIPPQSFKFEEIPNYYKTVNIYKFSRNFAESLYLPFLEAYCSALGNNEYYEQVLRVITLLDRPGIKALPLTDEHWYEIDDVQDLDIASSIFAEENEALKKIMSRYGGYWRYPYMLDFCYLVNPYFPNTRLKAEIKANFDKLLCEYPSGQRVNALLAAKDFHLKENYVVVGNGAAELIKSLMNQLNGSVGIIRPTFEEYPNRVDGSGFIEFKAENPDFKYDENDIINYFSVEKPDNIILVNPDNPSGNYISADGIFKLVSWSKKENIRLVVDESFLDFADNSETTTVLKNEILEENPHLIVVKSISKSYGVPGLRLGMAASADESFINTLRKDVAIWNINSFAEFYLQIYGKYEDDFRKSCVEFRKERSRFMSELSKIPFLRPIPSQANYFMCEITNGYSSKQLAEFLLKRNILIKDCAPKVDNRNYIRLAIRDRNDNDRLIVELKNVMQ